MNAVFSHREALRVVNEVVLYRSACATDDTTTLAASRESAEDGIIITVMVCSMGRRGNISLLRDEFLLLHTGSSDSAADKLSWLWARAVLSAHHHEEGDGI